MLLASFLIAANWLIYIYAVGHGQATQASLGYYIMPIISILFALIFSSRISEQNHVGSSIFSFYRSIGSCS